MLFPHGPFTSPCISIHRALVSSTAILLRVDSYFMIREAAFSFQHFDERSIIAAANITARLISKTKSYSYSYKLSKGKEFNLKRVPGSIDA